MIVVVVDSVVVANAVIVHAAADVLAPVVFPDVAVIVLVLIPILLMWMFCFC